MKTKKFLIVFLTVFLISIITITEIPRAVAQSDVYKQGIYDISEVKPFNATARLIKPGDPTSLSIVDINGNQKFYNRFDNESEIVNIGPINNADLIAIVGKGEIALTFYK